MARRSRTRKLSREEQLHADWLGMLQPEGLVVSIPVLAEDGLYVRKPPSLQAALLDLCPDATLPAANLRTVFSEILGWDLARLTWGADVPDTFELRLDDLGATLRPDGVLVHPRRGTLLLVQWSDSDPDEPATGTRWPASRHERFERLLVELQSEEHGTPVGLHFWPEAVRLTYAPAGEAAGSLTFPLEGLLAADGRVLLDALVMLVGRDRLFNARTGKTLLDVLKRSRERQDQVTVALAGQVEEALRLLVRGLDAANKRSGGAVFRRLEDAAGQDHIHRGLVTVLLRLVFLLYAEDRALLPVDDPLYEEHYSVAKLADQLADQRLLQPEAMAGRFGAWSRLLTLYRLVHKGAEHGDLRLPPRQGELFDPDAYPFLEGRSTRSQWDADSGGTAVPPLDDGVVEAVLRRLVALEGQRISYRNLDVEQIGSVYESMMGFDLRRAKGEARILKGKDQPVIELWEVVKATDPIRLVAQRTGSKPKAVKEACPDLTSVQDTGDDPADEAVALAALAPLLAEGRMRPGEHYLQPGSDRRTSGSHYTPRSLTRPIVERTLAPQLRGDEPATPEAILELKVCDPAMGSGAFLVEACRYLAERLVEAWARTNSFPPEATETPPLLLARRLIAERCLYGVDKNPFAVQLARLSLWLVTFSRDLPFTFVDHALREGDAIVGLGVEQIAALAFELPKQTSQGAFVIRQQVKWASRFRTKLHESAYTDYLAKRSQLREAQDIVEAARRFGDLAVACVRAGGTKAQVKKRLKVMKAQEDGWLRRDGENWTPGPEAASLLEVLDRPPRLRPFHWGLEFPEVFARENPGFDAVVGNPPFGGVQSIEGGSGRNYIPILSRQWPHSHGKSDLVAYFFMRASTVVRTEGTYGLIATNTISEGATRTTALQHLVADKAHQIFWAQRSMRWPVAGAAVVVSVVHLVAGGSLGSPILDGATVPFISSALKDEPELPDPVVLSANRNRVFHGSVLLGTGFILDNEEAALLRENERHWPYVLPLLGGRELNNRPDAGPERWAINFGELSLREASAYPDLLEIIRTRVKPDRDRANRKAYRERWWRYAELCSGLYRGVSALDRCLAASRVSKYLLFAFQPISQVFSESLNVFAYEDFFRFSCLQSRVHLPWAWAWSSSMKTDLRYTPSRCFETFPFPHPPIEQQAVVADAGEAFYAHRSDVMLDRQEGMTQVWNRLLDEDEDGADIVELRRLRDVMDHAVLAAYGWDDLDPDDDREIVIRLRKLNLERAAEEKNQG